MARLSGWKRIGIIASVVWMLGAGIFCWHAFEGYKAYQVFLGRQISWDDNVQALKITVFFALTPIPLAWGLAYLIVFLVNWVKRGFTSPGNSN